MKGLRLAILGLAYAALSATAQAQAPKKPNILVIWGDDVGVYNLGSISRS
jgi:hypothetical protein